VAWAASPCSGNCRQVQTHLTTNRSYLCKTHSIGLFDNPWRGLSKSERRSRLMPQRYGARPAPLPLVRGDSAEAITQAGSAIGIAFLSPNPHYSTTPGGVPDFNRKEDHHRQVPSAVGGSRHSHHRCSIRVIAGTASGVPVWGGNLPGVWRPRACLGPLRGLSTKG
jgi:hypothetical protein